MKYIIGLLIILSFGCSERGNLEHKFTILLTCGGVNDTITKYSVGGEYYSISIYNDSCTAIQYVTKHNNANGYDKIRCGCDGASIIGHEVVRNEVESTQVRLVDCKYIDVSGGYAKHHPNCNNPMHNK